MIFTCIPILMSTFSCPISELYQICIRSREISVGESFRDFGERAVEVDKRSPFASNKSRASFIHTSLIVVTFLLFT